MNILPNNLIVIGGPIIIVQINKRVFNHKVKAHRGRVPSNQVWGFGDFDTFYKPDRGFMIYVVSRNKETLFSIILQHIMQGSIIHSDEWKTYADLNENGYFHDAICHKYALKI